MITESAAIDTELGILKTGKEADVFLLERATGVPTSVRVGRQALSRARTIGCSTATPDTPKVVHA